MFKEVIFNGFISMIEVVRISEAGKSKLSAIKRRTGVENWNIINDGPFCYL